MVNEASEWRSEEDYYFARLAVALGLLDHAAMQRALALQQQALAAGQAPSLGQLVAHEGWLAPADVLRLKHELMRCYHPCPSCGAGRYAAPGPRPRSEPCLRCEAPVPVPAAGSSVSGSLAEQRQEALASGRWRREDPLGASAVGQAAPRLFADYLLEAEIARGGMGAVYRVRHARTGEAYALKVLLAGEKASETQVHRFKREARAQQELDHPNIVRIHEAGEWEGILYCVMDLVEGSDLGRAHAAMSLGERIDLLIAVARAIHHAHERGYVHRDLKPANVLIDREGRPRLTDFGLAKRVEGTTQLTQEGAILGTPFYMAPELATGRPEAVGPATDVFALGVILYELTTGQLPFVAESTFELYRQIVELAPEPFASHAVMEPLLEQVCFRALEKEPAQRYPSAAALADDLEAWRRGEVPAIARVGSAARVARQVQRHQRSLGVLAGLSALGLVVALALAVGFAAARRHLRRGQAEADARAALLALEHAREQAALLPHEQGARSLDEALEAGRALLGWEGLDSGRALREQVAATLVARATLALGPGALRGDGRDARAVLAWLEQAEALAGEARPAWRGEALVLQVRAAWRAGDEARAEAGLNALRAEAAGATPLLLLEAAAHRRAGRLDAADQALDQAFAKLAAKEPGPALDLAELHLERARVALARAGAAAAEEAAGEALAAAERRGGLEPADVLRAFAEALLLEGSPAALEAASEALLGALGADPGDVAAARALQEHLLDQGRPLAAARALEAAVRRRPGQDELELLLAEAQLHVGDERAPARVQALAPRLPAAALLAWELARARGVAPAQPLDAALAALSVASAEPRPDPVLLAQAAAVARARAEAGQLGLEAPAAQAALRALLADLPRDRPTAPFARRALRDLGWVALAAGEVALAGEAAQAALRGGPGDLDAWALLARASQAQAGAEPAVVAVAERLEGPLARGMLLLRAGAAAGRREAVRPLAGRLLEAVIARWPALGFLRADLRPGAAATPAAPPWWSAVFPPLRAPPAVSRERREEATALAHQADLLGRNENADAVVLLEQALERDPDSLYAWRELANRLANVEGLTARVSRAQAEYWVRQPSVLFHAVIRLRSQWQKSWLGANLDPVVICKELAADDAPRARAPWLLMHLLGLLYPEDEKPRWPRAHPQELVVALDRALRLDPQLWVLLPARAQLQMMLDAPLEAQRDLAAADLLRDRDEREPDGTPLHHWPALYRAWVLAPRFPDEAVAALAEIDEVVLTGGKDTGVRLTEWHTHHPHLERVRRLPAWQRFWQEKLKPIK